MNETIQNILARRSVRHYQDRQVSDADIELLLQCAQYAATGMGRQPWHFTVLQNADLMKRIDDANRDVMRSSGNPMGVKIADDPDFSCWRHGKTVIIASGDNEAPGAVADCANATENIAIAAKSLGLDTCYLGGFKAALAEPAYADLLAELKIPEGYTIQFGIAIGYADEEPAERAPRKENTVTYIR